MEYIYIFLYILNIHTQHIYVYIYIYIYIKIYIYLFTVLYWCVEGDGGCWCCGWCLLFVMDADHCSTLRGVLTWRVTTGTTTITTKTTGYLHCATIVRQLQLARPPPIATSITTHQARGIRRPISPTVDGSRYNSGCIEHQWQLSFIILCSTATSNLPLLWAAHA